MTKRSDEPVRTGAKQIAMRQVVVVLVLLLLTTSGFWKVPFNGFVSYDDSKYVTKNPDLRDGITFRTIHWAFTSAKRASNWHPLTWLSHALDWRIFGPNAGGHHLTSLLIHLANVGLLFLVLHRMTGAVWRSALVAALFGVHPLHVESVAWVAERKDVLSTFFWLLTMWAYVWYAELKVQGSRFKVAAYTSVIVFFALGLMSKPMLVTLPFVLFLLDYWPLGRFRVGVYHVGAKHLQDQSSNAKGHPANALPLLVEKVPLFVLAIGSAAMTFKAQQAGGSVASMQGYALGVRIANALVSYVMYLWKMLWPRGLAPFYPHPNDTLPPALVVVAALLLAGITILVLVYGRQRPYLAVGWLWYIGTLVPVIGLVQVGMQAMADRYTYVPLIGIFIMLAWGIPEVVLSARRTGLTRPTRPTASAVALSAGIAFAAFAACTSVQVGYWKNTVTLFEHAIAATEGNYVAHNSLGQELQAVGRLEEAIAHYSRAVQTDPDPGLAYNNLGAALAQSGRVAEAMKVFEEALKCDPDCAEAYVNLGRGLAMQGKVDEALEKLKRALEIDPDQAGAYLELGNMLGRKGHPDEAAEQFRRAIRIDPGMAEAHSNLGFVLRQKGRLDEAISEFEEAIRLRPNFAAPYHNLLAVYYTKGDYDEASRVAARAQENGAQLDPRVLEALSRPGAQ